MFWKFLLKKKKRKKKIYNYYDFYYLKILSSTSDIFSLGAFDCKSNLNIFFGGRVVQAYPDENWVPK